MLDLNLVNLSNLLSEAIILINTETEVLTLNKKAEQILGQQEKMLSNPKISALIPEISFDISCVLKNGAPIYEKKIKVNNSIVEANFIPVFNGNIICGIYIILNDITQVNDLIKENKYLKTLKNEMEDIIESFYDGIGIIDNNGTLLRVNKSYERITGLPQEENNVGRNVRDLEEEGTVSRAVALMVLTQKKPVTIVQRIKTGKEILITGSPVFNLKGDIYRVVCNIRDINELNILKELNKQADKNRESLELKELRARQLCHEELIYKSRVMHQIFELSLKVAKVDSNVLITGESGVGKEIIAKIIHKASPRAQKSFLQINCGAIPENLLESELFGYEGGAFTGARKKGKMGYFELSDGGALLLDEIGELPFNLQVTLLRALQEREVLRVGGTTPYKFDVRIIAATNRDLEDMVSKSLFRSDLFYRLNVVPIYIPPLRERKEDIIPLAIYFLEKFNLKFKANKRFEPEVLRAFERYNWPGNVREMENVIERLVIIVDDEIIDINHLPFIDNSHEIQGVNIEVFNPIPLQEASDILEKKLLLKALQLYGSTRKAAKVLGVSHPTVIRKAQKLNIKTSLL